MKKYLSAVTAMLLLCLVPVCGADDGRRWAVVNTSLCYLRAEPDYESALESQCLMGTVVEITGSERYWRKVDVPDYKDVWTNELVLAEMDEAQLERYTEAPKWICVAQHSVLYSLPDDSSVRVSDFILGDVVCKGDGTAVSKDGVRWVEAATAAGRRAWVREADVADLESWRMSVRADGESLLRTAGRMLGTPYLWGGCSVYGFDCSGLVKLVYMMNGIVLPRNAREQINCGVSVPYDLGSMRPGDLIFYGSKSPDGSVRSVTHVSMYIGDGRIIHSSQLVRINSIVPGGEDYYGRTDVVGVRRILR